jgi:hypothetical protein
VHTVKSSTETANRGRSLMTQRLNFELPGCIIEAIGSTLALVSQGNAAFACGLNRRKLDPSEAALAQGLLACSL